MEVEEELAYDKDGADRVEVEGVLKSLKELIFNLMGKIGQLAELDDTFEQDTHKDLLNKTIEKVIMLKKKVNELTRAVSETRVALEVARTVLQEEETKILNGRTEILIEMVERLSTELKEGYCKNVAKTQ